MANPAEFARDHREKISLLAYFLITLLFAPRLAQLFGTAWRNGDLFREIFDIRYLFGLSLSAVSAAIFGIFVGLLLLITLDTKKRFQGILLWVGTVIALAGLASMGLFLPNINFSQGAGWFVGGVIGGGFFGGGRQLLENRQTREFRRAARGVYLIILVLVVVAFFEAHVNYPVPFSISPSGIDTGLSQSSVTVVREGAAVDAFSAVVFVATLRRFVQYDSAEDFFVIGPRASGKSLFLVGSYLESQQSQQETSPKLASGDLMSLVEDHQRRSTEGWAVSATDPNEIRNLEFEYVHGDVFPKNVLVSTVDYGGENIGDIPDALTGSLDSMSNAMNRIVEDIRNSDTLICLIDSERFVEEDSLGINVYFDILRATSDDKDILIVATKADYFATEFYEEQNIEAHAYPEEFSEYVNKRLKRRAEVDSLLDTAVESTVHPVFFQTKKLDDGRRVPIRDSAGSVQRVGFEQVLERLGRL